MSDPIIIAAPDGTRVLVDHFGLAHSPAALVAAIVALEHSAVDASAGGYPTAAAALHQAADQRRVWLVALETTTEVPHE